MSYNDETPYLKRYGGSYTFPNTGLTTLYFPKKPSSETPFELPERSSKAQTIGGKTVWQVYGIYQNDKQIRLKVYLPIAYIRDLQAARSNVTYTWEYRTWRGWKYEVRFAQAEDSLKDTFVTGQNEKGDWEDEVDIVFDVIQLLEEGI